MWLMGAPISRPDKSHYVVDMMPDHVAVTTDEGKVEHVTAAQIWCDPNYPNAHRDPALYKFLLSLPIEGFAIVRWSQSKGIMLIPPHSSPTGKWYEMPSNVTDKLPEVS